MEDDTCASAGMASIVVRHAARICYNLGDELLKFARPGDVWIDVGAHLGEMTFPVAQRNSSLRVYAFEPNLKLAAQRMGALKNFVVLPMAVAEEDGCATFHINAFDQSSSLLPLDPEGVSNWIGGGLLRQEESVIVATIRLDTFMNRSGISKVKWLKVDAQGADLAVVRSAGERLKDIERITLEVSIAPRPAYLGTPGKEEVVRYMVGHEFLLASSETQTYGQEENLTFVREA